MTIHAMRVIIYSPKYKGAPKMLENSKNDFNDVAETTPKFYFKNEIPYATIPKCYLMDDKLSIKAKGLLTIVYCLPDKWEYNMRGLAKITNLTLKQLRPILKELLERRYITRSRKQNKYNKTFYYEYWIHMERYPESYEYYGITEDEEDTTIF